VPNPAAVQPDIQSGRFQGFRNSESRVEILAGIAQKYDLFFRVWLDSSERTINGRVVLCCIVRIAFLPAFEKLIDKFNRAAFSVNLRLIPAEALEEENEIRVLPHLLVSQVLHHVAASSRKSFSPGQANEKSGKPVRKAISNKKKMIIS
jgi:hypothetical protein